MRMNVCKGGPVCIGDTVYNKGYLTIEMKHPAAGSLVWYDEGKMKTNGWQFIPSSPNASGSRRRTGHSSKGIVL